MVCKHSKNPFRICLVVESSAIFVIFDNRTSIASSSGVDNQLVEWPVISSHSHDDLDFQRRWTCVVLSVLLCCHRARSMLRPKYEGDEQFIREFCWELLSYFLILFFWRLCRHILVVTLETFYALSGSRELASDLCFQQETVAVRCRSFLTRMLTWRIIESFRKDL